MLLLTRIIPTILARLISSGYAPHVTKPGTKSTGKG